ncbi:MAG: tetratricopeptide repeat protein [Planctomycetaceae bacterium]|nr:tetratricopeptide repeat protein [Planctomycetaceae bacterium]
MVDAAIENVEPAAKRDPLRWVWPVVLVMAVFVTFGQTLDFDFVIWDDDLHITANDRFQPLTPASLMSFWREAYEFLYIPLSYMLFAGEVAVSQLIYGTDAPLHPGVFHATSVLLHAVNVLLAFALLRRWDHDPAAACAGALVFALHPLQVESVAWISEQRGLLSATLSLVALWFYSRGETPSWRSYTAATIAFALAMLAKPSAVSVPLMAAAIDFGLFDRRWTSSALRLVPWLVLSVAVMLLTRAEQFNAHIEYVPSYGLRWWVAADAVGWYVAKVFWPFGFGFDPGRPASLITEGGLTDYTVLATMPILLAALATAVRQRPLAASAFITLAGLLPVMGFVPFVFQNISTVADRYAYLPLLGVGLAVSHVLAGSLSLFRWIPALAAIATAAYLSFVQAPTWRDSVTLYNHGLEINPQSWTAHHNLGNLYYRRGLTESAREHFDAALQLKPNHPRSLNNLGVIEFETGQLPAAADLFRRALNAAPWYSEAHANLGNVLWREGNRDAALAEYRRAIDEQPRNADARLNLARSLLELNQLDEAQQQIDAALEARPRLALAHLVKARILVARQQLSQAKSAAETALKLDSRLALAHELLGNLAFLEEKWGTALEHYEAALKLDGQLVEASYNRGLALLHLGRKAEARAQLERALTLAPAGSTLAETIRRELEQLRQP